MSKLFNIDAVRAATAEMRELLAGRTDTQPLSAKDQAIRDAVENGRWGCQDSSVRRLVEAITGVNCAPIKPVSQFVAGAMISYQDEPLLVRKLDDYGDAMVFSANGDAHTKDGDSYVQASDTEWRPATDEEIQAFFA